MLRRRADLHRGGPGENCDEVALPEGTPVALRVFGGRGSVYGTFIGAFMIGGIAAVRVQMTQMPELVAILHSLVGLAAVAVGFANFMDPGRLAHFAGVELTIHDIETYIGVLIGAVTFSGSVIAFGKLSGRIGSKPMILPLRHWLNLGLLIGSRGRSAG